MQRIGVKKLAVLAAAFFVLWLGLRYLLPVSLPFLLGAALALAAEPAAAAAADRLRLPRSAAALLGVGGTLLLLVCLTVLLGSAAVRELGVLAEAMPDLEDSFLKGLAALEDLLLALADRTADGIRPLLTRSVHTLFQSGTALIDRAVQQFPGLLSRFLSHVPDGIVSLGTGLLSAFMISARLPRLKQGLLERLPQDWRRYLPALRRIRTAVWGWLKAQVKLAGMTFTIVITGLFLLNVPHAPVWAAGIALVDALPLLGSGTVLLPWCVVCLIQGNPTLAIGLAAVYAAAALTRASLEPRLVGRQLGLDPLVTLISLYAGYHLWGIAGLFLAPLAAVVAVQAAEQSRENAAPVREGPDAVSKKLS